MLKININDIGKKQIDISNIEGSENAIKISKLDLNTEESQEKPLDIAVIPVDGLATPVKVAYLPLAAGFSPVKKVDFTKVDISSISPNADAIYQHCDMCATETNHYKVNSGQEVLVVCKRCAHGYTLKLSK
jgi:hypothetical protein